MVEVSFPVMLKIMKIISSNPLLGVHGISKAGSKITYVIYNLSTGKLVQECLLPTESGAFLGTDSNAVSLTITGEVR